MKPKRKSNNLTLNHIEFMNKYKSAKVIPMYNRKGLLDWIRRNDLTLWFLAIALIWVMLLNKFCSGQHENFQYNISGKK